MTSNDLSVAEREAEKATAYESFPVNLRDTRRTVEQILSLFGKNNIFEQYTVHDFSHVVEMLRLLEWLVPPDTQKIMSPGDWLMTVLSIYFHDLGLIVTQDEFKNRNESDFSNFCEQVLFSTPDGADDRAKIATLSTDERERFLYQEFVRANHAKRVRSWISGKPDPELGYARASIVEIVGLLSRLDPEFRRDLAVVCESHNLNDLDNIKKYKLSQPYGNTEAETVNLQYCSVLLRTADLLQVTRHRAPSVLYRLH